MLNENRSNLFSIEAFFGAMQHCWMSLVARLKQVNIGLVWWFSEEPFFRGYHSDAGSRSSSARMVSPNKACVFLIFACIQDQMVRMGACRNWTKGFVFFAKLHKRFTPWINHVARRFHVGWGWPRDSLRETPRETARETPACFPRSGSQHERRWKPREEQFEHATEP